MKNSRLKSGFILLSALVTLSTLFIGCKKDGNGDGANGSGYLRAKIDGKTVEFKFFSSSQNNDNSIAVRGNTGDINKGEDNTHIQIAVMDNEKIKIDTYELESTPTMVVTYGTVTHKSDGTSVQANFSATTGSSLSGDAFEVKIKSISKARVEGSFAGIVVATGKKNVVISEGEFAVDITNK